MSDLINAKRRALMQAFGAGMAASLLPAAHAATPGNAWSSAYKPYDGPFNTAFNGVLETARLRVEGRLPASLQGTFFRNGPARMRLGPTAYDHWFDGDGMVQRFGFADGKVSHRGVMLKTPKLVDEEAAGRFLYPTFGSVVPEARPVRNPDPLNAANINLLSMKGGQELYALWEGGSALKIDPATLDVQGFKAWSPDTAGAPFSAHPRIAPDGTVWNFGYMPGSGKLIVYEIGADGILKRQTLLAMPQADMVHDFAITERYLVFLLMPMIAAAPQRADRPFLDRFRWRDDAPLIAALVDKSDFSVRRFELSSGGVFHLGNAWEQKGVVRIDYVRQPDILGTLKRLQLDSPNAHAGSQPTRWTQVELDLRTGRATQAPTDLADVEFPRFDARYTGMGTDQAFMMQRSAAPHCRMKSRASIR